jgi:hypothetical protein
MAKSTTIKPSDRAGVEMAAIEAAAISYLCLWINEARALIDKVRICAQIDSELAACLKAHDVRINSADWEEETATGMAVLLGHQRSTINEAYEAARRMAKGGAV